MSSFGLPSRRGHAGPIRLVREPLAMGGFNYVWEDATDISLPSSQAVSDLSSAQQVLIPRRGLMVYSPFSYRVVNPVGSGVYVTLDLGFKIGAAPYWTSDERRDANYTYKGSVAFCNQITNDTKVRAGVWNATGRGTPHMLDSDFPACLIDIEKSGFPTGLQLMQPICRRATGPLLSGTGTLKGTITPTRIGILFVEW